MPDHPILPGKRIYRCADCQKVFSTSGAHICCFLVSALLTDVKAISPDTPRCTPARRITSARIPTVSAAAPGGTTCSSSESFSLRIRFRGFV
ncbi:hypothetical protein CALCODRAFT_498125 [Calocera cornea HHB12733]|uniref:C2H2-type domain-containing protein n=1 Tax=Calocera cornea HHB12733 TaxID=1353952 RepID=A0A165EYN9_9BASI|nr:hypothetical protein CALCODRAFT_498125 [Calocera cornea HHB12733]